MPLIEELKRRNVFRVGVAYAVGAWVLLQVLDVLGEILELPPWGGRLLLALLIVGFFLALIFAWAFELTPEGVKRDAEVDHSQPLAAQTGRRLNRLIIVTLVLALALFAADKFLWDPARDRALVATAAEQARSDRHLWSETYDRDLDDVLAVQGEIANAIVGSMRQELGLDIRPEQAAIAAETESADAYDLYLQGRALILARADIDRAVALLEQAVAIDPGFAKAWEVLGGAEPRRARVHRTGQRAGSPLPGDRPGLWQLPPPPGVHGVHHGPGRQRAGIVPAGRRGGFQG